MSASCLRQVRRPLRHFKTGRIWTRVRNRHARTREPDLRNGGPRRKRYAALTLVRALGVAVDLSGKVAFVTGGSGDIGKAIVGALAASGMDVAVSYAGDADRAGAVVDAVRRVGRKA